MGTAARRYKEVLYVSHGTVSPTINTEMARVFSRLEWDRDIY